MAALASAPQWIPEDDLLLKNAVEGGASLEALAKGAVPFSRTYTVKELRDRWYSLLYDPVVSAEASTRMIESENSAKKSGNGNKNSESTIKRKFESVRSLYYSMRKRLCREINGRQLSESNSYLMDHNVIGENNPNGYLRNDCSRLSERVQGLSGKKMVRSDGKKFFHKNDGDEFRDFAGTIEIGPSHGLQDSSASYEVMRFASPLWENLEDIEVPEVPLSVNHQDLKEPIPHHETADGVNVHSSSYDPQDMKEDEHGNADAEVGVSVILGTSFVDLSDCLLNLGNEDGPLTDDVDVKDTEDEGKDVSDVHSGVGGTSHVLTYHEEKLDDTSTAPADVDESTRFANKSDLLPGNNDSVSNQLDLGHSNHLLVVSGQVDDPSYVTDPKSCFSTDKCDEFPICTLNTEDPEIPINNAFHSPTASVSSLKCISGSSLLQLPSSDKEKEQLLRSVLRKEDNPLETSQTHSWKDARAHRDGDPNSCHPHAGLKIEVSDAQVVGSAKETISPNADVLPHRILVGATKDCTLEANSVDACNAKSCSIDAEEDLVGIYMPELEGSPSGIDLEEDESDLLVPSFADIEAMILNMELCPKEWDSSPSELSRYQKEDARRAIIRLEQCAQSSIRRAICYRGALAILYGRQSRHYIKKAEVILGRSTDGFEVDIDLGTEGGSNRISRRQALIKLERDASFTLKNLGKSSMFLNGKEVCSGKCVRLMSSCLLEVKGIAFVFETDERSVQKYLSKGSQNENTSFKWSGEEKVPGIKIK